MAPYYESGVFADLAALAHATKEEETYYGTKRCTFKPPSDPRSPTRCPPQCIKWRPYVAEGITERVTRRRH